MRRLAIPLGWRAIVRPISTCPSRAVRRQGPGARHPRGSRCELTRVSAPTLAAAAAHGACSRQSLAWLIPAARSSRRAEKARNGGRVDEGAHDAASVPPVGGGDTGGGNSHSYPPDQSRNLHPITVVGLFTYAMDDRHRGESWWRTWLAPASGPCHQF